MASETFPNGVLDATSFGPCCPQPTSGVYIPSQDEQCLYLNVYKPTVPSNSPLLPVLVWIHGGALKIGCSSQSTPVLFNGTNMIAHAPPDQQVIVVTINYRLGVLTDMYLNELVAEDPQWPTAGNYNFLDMLSALRWIQKNIPDYGGDPTNVTIFGQSAGGLSVVDLGAVKGSANLYNTAISQSGLGSPGTNASYSNTDEVLTYSNIVVNRLACASNVQQTVLECIRSAAISDVLDAYGYQFPKPIIDNYFFPLYPPLAIQNGTYNNVTLIMGNNDYEQAICYQHPDMNFNDSVSLLIQSIDPKWIPLIADYYHLNNCSSDRNANISRCCNIVRLILMDKIFDCDIRRIFNAFYLKYGPVYAQNKLFSYHLNCYPECPVVQSEGICGHSSELPFVFGTISDAGSQQPVNCTWDNQTRVFSDSIISHWTNAATTGRPGSQWPSYDPSTPMYFHITPDQGFSPETWRRNCSFFDGMEAEEVREKFKTNN